MSDWHRNEQDMTPIELDLDTADRILSGAVEAADAPPGFESVVQLLQAATLDETARSKDSTSGVWQLVWLRRWRRAARRASRADGSAGGRRWPWSARSTVFSATAGLAVAGALPGPAQDAVSKALHHVGVSVPGILRRSG